MFLLAKALRSQIHGDMTVLGGWGGGGDEELSVQKFFLKLMVVLVVQQICI